MNPLTRHALVAATAAPAVAAGVLLRAQDGAPAPGGPPMHALPAAGDALLLAAVDVFCPVAAKS